MEDAVIIPLRPDRAPSTMRVLGWLVALNFVMAMVSVVMIGLLTTFLGTQWMEDPAKVAAAVIGSLLLIALFFGALVVVVRRRSRVAAVLELGSQARLVGIDGTPATDVPRDELAWRPVQLYDTDGSETYPVGPALELTFPDRKLVLAHRNPRVRWGRDVASVLRTDWVLDEEPFHALLDELDVDEELVPY